MLTWAFYCLFLTATFAQTINKNDYCWEQLLPMRSANDTLNNYKIARYQQCMRQVGYTLNMVFFLTPHLKVYRILRQIAYCQKNVSKYETNVDFP